MRSILTFLVAVALIGACSSDNPVQPSSVDGGTFDGGAVDAMTRDVSEPSDPADSAILDAGIPDSAEADVGEPIPADAREIDVNGCTEAAYVDATTTPAKRTITWDPSIETAPERCTKISVGQTITFVGDFDEHPLVPRNGDADNPIAANHAAPRFDRAGTFGYYCEAHPEMIGAIKVVP